MADFCASCVQEHLQLPADKNDFNREPNKPDSEIDFSQLGYHELCEGCGLTFLDVKGWPMDENDRELYRFRRGQVVQHIKKQDEYVVLDVANETAPEYPTLVVYKRKSDGQVFARSINVFARKFRVFNNGASDEI